MTADQTWRTTTTEIIEIFRESLIVLAPVMEKAHLSWKEGEAYDEWDRIASSLFEGVVVSALQWGLRPGEFTEVHLPAYDMIYPDYHEFSFIECMNDSPPLDSYLLFHRFITRDNPFDTVQCHQVEKRGLKLTPNPVIRPAAGARFAFQLRRSADELTRCEELRIQVAGANRVHSQG